MNDSRCNELNGMAERELTSFYTAVKTLFGAPEAERSASAWILEVASRFDLPRTIEEWREITIQVAQRLALRMDHAPAA